MRVGVAGAGALGRHHVRILRELAGDRFAGFYDGNAARAATVASELGVTAFTSLDALLDATDAVSVVVPTRAHAATASAVLSAGRHAFIEKPVTATVAEADALVALVAGRGLTVQVGHVERYNRAVRAARPYIDAPRYLEAARHNPYTPRGADVSVVADLMIHDVDLVLWLVGQEPTRIDASGGRWMRDTTDVAEARLTFADGAVANLSAMRLAAERRRTLTVWQANGVMRLDLAAGTAEFLRLRQDVDPAELAAQPQDVTAFTERLVLDAPEGETLRMELSDWLGAIAARREPPVTLAAGRAALAVAQQIDTTILGH
ncbi:MAG: Gfo/Idh/MocA family oxidoreductase [Gemmatimonadaceae bacterium]|nr:Gfo/Idh/MocA family oxidoreductase [Gemmatimonadaceae bacterium]